MINDLRYSLRRLIKQPAFTAVAVVTLTLGIGANTAIFSVIYSVLLQPLPYGDSDRLVRIDETEGRGGMGVSPPNFLDFQQQNQSFENVSAYTGGSFVLTGGNEPLRLESCAVSANLFSVLKANPLFGRTFSAADENEDQNQVAVLGFGLWQRRFGGDPEILGRQITLDGKSYSVIGIMPPAFEFPIQTNRVEVWTPLPLPKDLSELRGAHYLDVVGRLKPNVPLTQAQADLDAIATRIAKQFPDLVSGRTLVVPLKRDLVGSVEPYLLMLAGAVALVLLIATANVSSLLLARVAERQKEIAVRLALGAGRFQLLRQFVLESLTLSLLGGLGGVLFATWGVKLLLAIAPADVPRLQSASLNTPVLFFALGVSLVTGLLCGLFPAWRFSVAGCHSLLKEGEGRTATGPRQFLRKALVVTEITLAMVLLCGAGLLIRTMWKLNAVQPGFDPEGVLVAEIGLPQTKYPTQTSQAVFSEELIERMKTLPEVASVGATTNLPMSGTNMMFMASVEGGAANPSPAGFRSVAGDYFQTMRVPLLKGRVFDERDTGSSTHVAVVNETMARQIAPGGEAIGKRIKHGFKQATAEVVGVVGDVKYEGLDSKNKPEMYVPFAQRAWPFLRLVVRAKTEPARLASAVRSQVQAIDKDQPVDKMRTMRAILNTSTAPRRFYAQLLGAFAGLAFMLAALGIYGVVSYSVARRTREIGIRMAVGAKQRDVLRMVLAEGLTMSFIGGLLGLAGAFAATRMLRNLLFEVSATDPGTFVTLLFLLAGVALLASYIPARRATKVDPLTALRYE